MDETTKRRRTDAVLTSDLPWTVRAALAAHHPRMDDETMEAVEVQEGRDGAMKFGRDRRFR